MEGLLSNMPMVVFFIVGAIAIAASVLVVSMRNPVHSALFLLLTFLCVAILFFLAHAEFVGAVQILVYAGGIMVLFLFVVMLINVRDLPAEKMVSPYWRGAIAVGFGVILLFGTVIRGGDYHAAANRPEALRPAATSTAADAPFDLVGNSEAVGMVLYRDYLVPFEVASLFLLVAMIGAIVIGKRELRADEEEQMQSFIIDRAAEEREVKEAVG